MGTKFSWNTVQRCLRDWTSAFRVRVSRVAKEDLFRALGVLVGGTAFAHIITAGVLPLSTRLYSPTDFSVAAAFMSVVNILAAASCLRYEMAIPLVDDETDAVNLLALSCLFSAVIGGSLAMALWIWPGLFAMTGQAALAPYGWLIAPMTTLTGVYFALQMWFVRQKAFRVIAGSRVGQSMMGAGLQIGLGVAGVSPAGLMVGQGANAGGGALLLAARLIGSRSRRVLAEVRVRHMATLAAAHVRFPKFSVAEALANSASIYAPVLLITALVPGPTAGYLALATFVLQAPMALVGNSIQQIFVASAPDHERSGRLEIYVVDMLRKLAKFSAAPLVCLAVAGPALFALLFGDEWRPSGVLVMWMMPWFFVQFLTSPVSTVLHIRGRQGAAMSLQLTGLVLRLTAVALVAGVAPEWVAEAYAVSGFVFYSLYLAVIFWVMKLGAGTLFAVAKGSLISAAVGLAGGYAILFSLPAIQHLLSKLSAS